MTDSNNITARAVMNQIRKWSRAIDGDDRQRRLKYQRRAFVCSMVQMQRQGLRSELKEPETLAYMLDSAI